MSTYISFTLSLRFLFQDDAVGHCRFSFKIAVRLGYLGSDQVKSSFTAGWMIVKEGQLEHLIIWKVNGKMNETSCKLMHHSDPHSLTFDCATCSCFPPPRPLRAVERTKTTFLHLQTSGWARQMVYHYEILYFHVLLSRVSCYFHCTARVRGIENISYLCLIVLNILVIPNVGIFFLTQGKNS